MLRTTHFGDTLEWPEDDKTGDGLPPLEPVNFSDVQIEGNDAFNAKWASWGHTLEQVASRDAMWAERLAAAVTSERELCAQVCDARDMRDGSREDQEARRCAAAIRGRE